MTLIMMPTETPKTQITLTAALKITRCFLKQDANRRH
jgi:hypothetical protein